MQHFLRMSQCWLALLFVAAPTLLAQAPQAPGAARVLVRINGMNNDFSRFGPIAASASGQLAVAQPQDGTVLLFSADGRQLATIGRKGSGPGEFRGINQLGWSGDTLWVADYSNNRLSLIGPTGRIAREIALPLRVDESRVASTVQGLRWSPRVQALHRDGTLLFSARRASPAGAPNGPREIEEWFIRGKMDGELQAAVLRSPPNACSRRSEGATVVQVVLHFCPQPMTAVATDGSHLVVATMTTTEGGSGAYTLTMRNSEGKPTWTRSATTRLEPVPGALRDSPGGGVPNGQSCRSGAHEGLYHSTVLSAPDTLGDRCEWRRLAASSHSSWRAGMACVRCRGYAASPSAIAQRSERVRRGAEGNLGERGQQRWNRKSRAVRSPWARLGSLLPRAVGGAATP